jgi:DNA-binding GntR family transcriptional regulator
MFNPGEARRPQRKGGMKGDWGPSVTLVEKIADELRERIIDGTFQAGEHLQQAALAKRMGVSSIPLRETIRLLENEGFVEILPFKGARVKALTRQEIDERTKIAFALESYAVGLALPTLTEEDLDRAEELASRIYPVSDVRTWNARIFQFIRIIYGADRWPLIFALIVQNRISARRYTEILVRNAISNKERPRAFPPNYFLRLVKFLRSGDLEGARNLQKERVDLYLEAILPWLAARAEPSKRRVALRKLKGTKSPRALR